MKALVFWLSILFVVCVIFTVVSSQQGGLIQARVFSPTAKNTTPDQVTTSADATPNASVPPVDTYTQLENYCTTIKDAAITNCGDEPPDQDYACRTEEADKAFTACMQNTDPATLNDLYPSPPPQP